MDNSIRVYPTEVNKSLNIKTSTSSTKSLSYKKKSQKLTEEIMKAAKWPDKNQNNIVRALYLVMQRSNA